MRRSEQRFRALVQHASELMIVWNERGVVTYASPATFRFATGRDPEDLSGEIGETNVFLHPDDLPHVDDLVRKLAFRPGGTERFVARYRRHDGVYRSLEVTVTNLLGDPDISGIVANSRDITEQLESADALQQSERRWGALVSNSSDIVAVIGAQGRLEYVSPSVRHVLGYSRDELQEHLGGEFLHPDEASAMRAHFEHVVASPGFHAPVELRARHADGSWRWIEVLHTNQLDNSAVAGIVLNIRDITERKRIEEQLAHQALHDSLTGLPNRVLLADRLTQALSRAARHTTNVGVLFLDLDRFKLVNDSSGHAVGDRLLAAVARRLRAAIRSGDTIARFGGDEFVVVYESVVDGAELVELGEQIRVTLSEPFDVAGANVYVTASVGAALGGPTASAEALLRDADAAMYHAKEQGGDAVEVVDAAIRDRASDRFETEHALRQALQNDELALVYQPIVRMDTRRVVAVESLIRWHHPQWGTIEPTNFIDLAEETGLVMPIGSWVLEEACKQIAIWRARPDLANLGVTVNVSVVQLRDATLPAYVGDLLARTGLDPTALTLEITESFVLDDTATCLGVLRALKMLGVRLAVDDFGTGYSSLGYLNRIPLDALKIDKTFVTGLGATHGDDAIVAAIVAMANAFGLSVVAEGVETAAQVQHLLELDCRLAQGFRYSPPLPPDELTPHLRGGLLAESASITPS